MVLITRKRSPGNALTESRAELPVSGFIDKCINIKKAGIPCFRSISATSRNQDSGSSVAFDTYFIVAATDHAVQFQGKSKNYLEVPIRNIIKVEIFDNSVDITTKSGLTFSLTYVSKNIRQYFTG